MDSIIGLLIGLLEAGLALWFPIELISNTCYYGQKNLTFVFSFWKIWIIQDFFVSLHLFLCACTARAHTHIHKSR